MHHPNDPGFVDVQFGGGRPTQKHSWKSFSKHKQRVIKGVLMALGIGITGGAGLLYVMSDAKAKEAKLAKDNEKELKEIDEILLDNASSSDSESDNATSTLPPQEHSRTTRKRSVRKKRCQKITSQELCDSKQYPHCIWISNKKKNKCTAKDTVRKRPHLAQLLLNVNTPEQVNGMKNELDKLLL